MTDRAALDPAVVGRLRLLTPPGEPDVLREILTVFRGEVPRRVERLKAAWRAGDAQGVQRAAHSLKGSSGNIGADTLFEVCRSIDERARAGDLNLSGAIDALEAEFARVDTAIGELLR